jgi:hypothetical protein
MSSSLTSFFNLRGVVVVGLPMGGPNGSILMKLSEEG